VAVTDRDPVQVVLALRAHDLFDLSLEQLPQHPQPDLDRQGEQPLSRCPWRSLQTAAPCESVRLTLHFWLKVGLRPDGT
jgi:hypothetical protein